MIRVNGAAPSGSAPGTPYDRNTVADPHWASVMLLLHGNGANGSTTFTDSSARNTTMTVGGNAIITTADKKFGTGSMVFDGTSDYLLTPAHADFTTGTAPFTVECWAKERNVGPQHPLWSFAPKSASPPYGMNLYLYNGDIHMLYGWNSYGWAIPSASNPAAATATSWHHYAFQRTAQGGFELFIDGVLVTPTLFGAGFPTGVNFATDRLLVGAMFQTSPTEYGYDGWIDDFRYTKGVARYDTNFVPPVGEYLQA